MKGIRKFIAALVCCCAVVVGLVGCASGYDTVYMGENDTGAPNIRIYKREGNCFEYLVDENTDVVYLFYIGGHSGVVAMTVMLDADGKPLTAQKLNLK